MYECPISVKITNTATSMGEAVNEEIYKVVLNCDIAVDKEELEKALIYDRRQYYHGYDDAIKDAIDLIVGTESEVAKNAPYDKEWFTRMADRQQEILELLRGMI